MAVEWGYWKHSRHTVIWLYYLFDSWFRPIPSGLETMTPASVRSGRRRGKLLLSHLDRCSLRWSLSSELVPTLTATDWESHRARWVIGHRSWLIWLQATQNFLKQIQIVVIQKKEHPIRILFGLKLLQYEMCVSVSNMKLRLKSNIIFFCASLI